MTAETLKSQREQELDGRSVTVFAMNCVSFGIPPTQLVDYSYLAYARAAAPLPNPTNIVGGLFISCLLTKIGRFRLGLNNPPTALVGFSGPPSYGVGCV